MTEEKLHIELNCMCRKYINYPLNDPEPFRNLTIKTKTRITVLKIELKL